MIKLGIVALLVVLAVPAGDVAAQDPAAGPVVSAFSVSPQRFRVGRKRTHAVIARAAIGTTFSYTLSTAATVQIALEHRLRGRLVGDTCVRGRRSLSKHPRCVRFRPMGVIQRNGLAGDNKVRFTGRLVRTRPFPLGTYRATIVATAGGASSAPRSVVFRIVP
jgi:hypothetical protein